MIYFGKRLDQQDRTVGFRYYHSEKRKNEIIMDSGSAHLMTIAPTGAGKGTSCIIPALLTYPGSVIVIDPKGEAAMVTRKARQKRGQVFVVDPFRVTGFKSASFNPFELMLSATSVETRGTMLAAAIMGDQQSKKDPFWDNKGMELIAGLCIHQFEAKKSFLELRNYLLNADTFYSLAVLLDNAKDMNDYAYRLISSFLSTTDITRSGILSTAQQYISFLSEPAVLASLCGNNDLTSDVLLGDEIYTIYLVIPPNKLHSFKQLLRIWVASLLNVFEERIQQSRLATLFLMDEAGNIGRLSELISGITLLRAYGVRLWTFFQDFAQVKALYPTEYRTLINNSETLQVFGVNRMLSAKEAADIIGFYTPSDFIRMPQDQAVIITRNEEPQKIQLLNYRTDPLFSSTGFSHNPYYRRRR